MRDSGGLPKGDKPRLYLFAKAPVPGAVKTRLTNRCTADQAAEIAAVLIRATVDLAVSEWPGEKYLCVWPDTSHPLFRELSTEYGLNLVVQADGDLGQKMYASLYQGIIQRGAAAVMGCDVPHCPGNVLNQAYTSLQAGQNVIGPSVDGGFYLLGMCQLNRAIFSEVKWGSSDVYETTLGSFHKHEIVSPVQLTTLRDIDYWDDLIAAAKICHRLKPFVV